MVWRVVIDFDPHPEREIGKVRNFGEDLWRACRDDTGGWASTSLDEADRATNQLRVTVTSARRIRRTVKMIEDLLGEHFLDRCARISVRNMGE